MKRTAEEFKQTLSGVDNVASVNALKEVFAKNDEFFTVSVTRRKLASGIKYYFHVKRVGNYKLREGRVLWNMTIRDFVFNHIYQYFPDAYLTSGGTLEMTIASY